MSSRISNHRAKSVTVSFEDLDFHHPERQPTLYDDLFRDILKLGNIQYEDYCVEVTADLARKPWKKEIQRRAQRVADKAVRHRQANSNEMEWRLALEHEVMKRFEFEVNCQKCRKRLWMSEIEGWVGDETLNLAGVRKQRQARDVCNCGLGTRGDDIVDPGLNQIFDSHASESIDHGGQNDLKPDLVYGLRCTRRLERILTEIPGHDGKTIGETVKTSLFKPQHQPVLFPFLVMEAKSEKSDKSLTKIEQQTKVPISSILRLQQGLKEAAGEASQWETGPFAWFLSNRGENWYVAAAFIEKSDKKTIHRVVQLWDGRVTKRRSALQLLLIVDYIFDWARDIYRTIIIDELLTLVPEVPQSLLDDSDRVSVLDFRVRCDLLNELDVQSDQELAPTGEHVSPDLLDFLNTGGHTIRDASFMKHQFIGLEITHETVDSLLIIFPPAQDQKRARQLQKCLGPKFAWRVTSETLDELEMLWTGNSSEHKTFRSPDQMFTVNFTVSSRLSGPLTLQSTQDSWEQTHTLSYVAVADDAIAPLKARTKLQKGWCLMPEECPIVSRGYVVSFFRKIRKASVHQCLEAARSETKIRTASLRLRNGERGDFTGPFKGVSYTVPYKGILAQLDDLGDNSLPIEVYNRLKNGRSEPNTPYLRTSSHKGHHTSDPDINLCWPSSRLGFGPTQRVLFVYDPQRNLSCSRFCIFFFPSPGKLITQYHLLPYDHLLMRKRISGSSGVHAGRANNKKKAEHSFFKLGQIVGDLHQVLEALRTIESLVAQRSNVYNHWSFVHAHEQLERRKNWRLDVGDTLELFSKSAKTHGLAESLAAAILCVAQYMLDSECLNLHCSVGDAEQATEAADTTEVADTGKPGELQYSPKDRKGPVFKRPLDDVFRSLRISENRYYDSSIMQEITDKLKESAPKEPAPIIDLTDVLSSEDEEQIVEVHRGSFTKAKRAAELTAEQESTDEDHENKDAAGPSKRLKLSAYRYIGGDTSISVRT